MDFIKSDNLSSEYVCYLGDEFYIRVDSEGNKQIGNDEVVARCKKLKNVNTIAVNSDNLKGAHQKTIWIGRSPQAVLEFLEQIITE